ncbi:6172_t:CDS:1, partial [Gigaspora margarita]
REWHVFVEGGFGFYCVSEYFEFIKKGLLEYFLNFKISEKADKFCKSNSIVIKKVLDKKKIIEMAKNTFKRRLIYIEDDD